jgi:hypothetical protein
MKNLLFILLLISSIPLYSQVTPEYPGVYITELPNAKFSISSLPTDITAFIGCTEKNINEEKDAFYISSLAEYEQQFGGAPSPQLKLVSFDDATNIQLDFLPNTRYFLYHSIRLFFENGGNNCYVISAGDYTNGVQKKALLDGMELYKNVFDLNQISIPDAMLLTRNERAEVQQKMLLQAKANNYFALLDVFEEMDNAESINNFRADIQHEGLKYGAAYYPWLKIRQDYEPKDYIVGWDDFNIQPDSDLYKSIKNELIQQLEAIPPSGAIAGIYATTDNRVGVWKAPANVSITGITGFTTTISDAEQATMNVSLSDGKSVNALRNFNGKGNLVWGARTLAGNDNEWRYISVRRLNSSIEHSINGYLQQFVFEENSQVIWTSVNEDIGNYLNDLWKSGALQGNSPKESYNVQVGLGKTMTAENLLNGKMKIQVSISPVHPAEFLILNFEVDMIK